MKHKYFIIVLFAAAIFIPRQYALYFSLAAVLYLSILELKLFWFIRRRSFLLFASVLLLVQPIATGEKDIFLLGMSFSSDGFYNGVLMILRAIVMIPSIHYLFKTADKNKLRKIFGKIGVKNYNEILSNSLEIFPLIKENIKKFISSTKRKNLFNPVELTARLIALLIKSACTYSFKAKERNIL